MYFLYYFTQNSGSELNRKKGKSPKKTERETKTKNKFRKKQKVAQK